MKWFKHIAASWDDEGLAKLVSKGGMEGLARYGLWWRVVEIVAMQLDTKGANPSVRYPVTRWSLLLSLRGSLVFSTLSTLTVTGGVTVKRDGGDIRVTIPNLLKYRDEYSKKSGHNQESVGPKNRTEGKGEGEGEGDKNKIIPSDEPTGAIPDSAPAAEDPPPPPAKPKPKRVRKPAAPKHSTDPRHIACKEAVFAYYRTKNDGEDPDWEGREGRALGMFLSRNPKLTAEGVTKLLSHRWNSEVNHSERPAMWLDALTSYRNGPIDRFGKPLSGGKANGKFHADPDREARLKAIAANQLAQSERRPA